MSTLLVDVGNSRIKWTHLRGARLSRMRAAVYQGWRSADFERVLFAGSRPRRVLVASVAAQAVDRRLTSACRRACGLLPEFVRSARRLGGVVTRYAEPWRLGVDRLVAVIGARERCPERAVLVVDIGTAMTLDLLAAEGTHRGGAIVPGPELMVATLLRGTSGIARRARSSGGGRTLFARHTRAAIEQGARFAAASLIERAAQQARRSEGAVRLLVTGGAATAVTSLLRTPHERVPDLVLRGLSVLARV